MGYFSDLAARAKGEKAPVTKPATSGGLSAATGSDAKYGQPTQKPTYTFNGQTVNNPNYPLSTKGGITLAEQRANMSIADETARNELQTENTKLQALREAAQRSQQQNIVAIKKTQTTKTNILGVEETPQSKVNYSMPRQTTQERVGTAPQTTERQKGIQNVKNVFMSIGRGEGAQLTYGNERVKAFAGEYVIPQSTGGILFSALPIPVKGGGGQIIKGSKRVIGNIWPGTKNVISKVETTRVGKWGIGGLKIWAATEGGLFLSRQQEKTLSSKERKTILKEIESNKDGNNILNLQRENVPRIFAGKQPYTNAVGDLQASDVKGLGVGIKENLAKAPLVQSGISLLGRKTGEKTIEANKQYYLNLGYSEKEAESRARTAYDIYKRRTFESDISLVAQSAAIDKIAGGGIARAFTTATKRVFTAPELKNYMTWQGFKTLSSYSAVEANINRQTERRLFSEGRYKTKTDMAKDVGLTTAGGVLSSNILGLPVFRYTATNQKAARVFTAGGYAADLSELGGDIALNAYERAQRGAGIKVITPNIQISGKGKDATYSIGAAETGGARTRYYTPTGNVDVTTTTKPRSTILTSIFTLTRTTQRSNTPRIQTPLPIQQKTPVTIEDIIKTPTNIKTPDNINNKQENIVTDITNQNIVGQNIAVGSFTPQMRVPPPLPPLFTIPSGASLGKVNKNTFFVSERSEAARILKGFGFTKFKKAPLKKKVKRGRRK